MCEKCTELDFKIAHYSQMTTRLADQLTLDAIAALIKDLKNAQAALHPEEEK